MNKKVQLLIGRADFRNASQRRSATVAQITLKARRCHRLGPFCEWLIDLLSGVGLSYGTSVARSGRVFQVCTFTPAAAQAEGGVCLRRVKWHRERKMLPIHRLSGCHSESLGVSHHCKLVPHYGEVVVVLNRADVLTAET